MKALLARPAMRSLVAAVALLALPLSACVEDVGLIDRTSPDKIDKRLFEGVWMYWQTTIDAPYSTAISFTGETNFFGEGKVIFDVQENQLIAYPVVERIDGTEKGWKTNSIRKYWDPEHRDEFIELYVGQPLAIWPIESHFDVIRDYNTYNGAQSNELVENTTDRPWYERDYMRVQWHQQVLGTLFYELFGGVGPWSYFVDQSKDDEPDAMTLDREGGYFDYVVRTKVAPTGKSRCSIFGLSPYDCASAEVRVRHSFRRMDPRRDYQPMRFHNNEHQDKFGYFLTERSHYDEDWGPSYEGSISWINRWNLWRDTYDFALPTDADGNELTVSCMEDYDCDEDGGERCQKELSAFEIGTCMIPVARPYAERGLRPVIYHLSADWHPDYLDGAYATAEGWSKAFKEAVSWQLFNEEKGLGDTRGCETHADCTSPGLLIDTLLDTTYDGIACHADLQCGAGFCGANGFCAEDRKCGAQATWDDDTNNWACPAGVEVCEPCAVGQTCEGGFCMVDGVKVQQQVETLGLRASTVVYHGDGHLVTYDNFANTTLATLQGGHAFVRFIHADSDGGAVSVSFSDDGDPIETISGGGYDADRDYDPQDPVTTGAWLGQVPASSGVKIEVIEDGVVVADRVADFVANHSYTVVWNGKDVRSYVVTFADSDRGVRFIHASADEAEVDFAIEGVRMDKAVEEGDATLYQYLAGSKQRVTISRSGTRGDITCYEDDDIGRCVGWGEEFTDADYARRAEIEDGLPDMFVLCENQYDELAATATENIAAGALTKAKMLDESDIIEWTEADHFGDAWYTYDVEGQPYNPCGDPDLVAHPADLKRIGDIRYSYFYWINEAQRAGPLGYGPSLADPDTGQLISATANIYGGAIHTYAQYAADMIALVNGDIDTDDYVTGQWIREWLDTKDGGNVVDPEAATVYGALATADQAPGDHADHDHAGDKAMNAAALYGNPMVAKQTALKAPSKLTQEYELPELMLMMGNSDMLQSEVAAAFPQIDPKYYHDRLNKVKGTWIEDLLMNDEVLLAGKFAQADADAQGLGKLSWDQLKDEVSPLGWASKWAMGQEAARTQLFAERNMYMGEFIDDTLWGLAKELEAKGYGPDEMRLELGRRILRGVLEHEVGHTVGLRHNFSGSTDVFNFFDEYYEVREKEPIGCQNDDWCDSATGEVCGFVPACAGADDCFGGLWECVGGLCMAPQPYEPDSLVETGVCMRPKDDIDCNTDGDCDTDAHELCLFSGQKTECHTMTDQLVPRQYISDQEKIDKRTEYQYTTIMDYGGRFNSDFHGLGKYDLAAIRFGYAGLVDTYTDPSRVYDRVQTVAENYGYTPSLVSWYLDTRNWPTRGTGFYHAFQYLTNFIGVEENLLRTPRPYEQVKYQKEMVRNDTRRYIDYEFIEVPYAMCSDEYRGNMGCYYFDLGIDAGEMGRHAADQLEQYYIFDAFKRDRLYYGRYGSPTSYYGRIMDRYLRVLGDVGMYYGFYDTLLFRYAWYQEWKDSPLGGQTYERAAREAFGKLLDTVSSPSPGSYRKVGDVDAGDERYVHVSFDYDAPDSDMNMPLGIGRFPYTQYGQGLGYNYWEHPLWFGSFWEKLGALVTLTDSTAYFVDTAVGEQLNIGVGTSIGFNTVFADEMNAYLGGVLAEVPELYTGRIINGRYEGPSVALAQDDGVPVEPGLNTFTLRLYSALFGLAYLPAGFDPRFVDATAVFLEGEAVAYEHANQPGVLEHRFVDPIGGKIYLAYSNNYGKYGSVKISPAVELVDRAQAFAEQWYDATGEQRMMLEEQMAEIRETLDLLRDLFQFYGSSTLGL